MKTDKFRVSYWDESKDECIRVDDENQERIARELKCSPELVEFLRFNFELLTDDIHEDLKDIWKRLE